MEKMGRLIFKTKNSELTILNGLNGYRMREIITLIEKEIEQRCS